MKLEDSLLEILEEAGEPASGSEMAARLGVTRNAVWKAMGRLREQGYRIEGTTNRGYRLVSSGAVLSAENIRRLLRGPARRTALRVEESVASTNTLVKELAEAGGAEGMVVIAREQTAGKGRLGRTFYSPKGTGLYMSLLLRPKFDAGESLWITTAAAVAVARAIESSTGRDARIKWVNDVYVGGYKVCGILTEASVDFETRGLHYAVLGIGINVQEPPQGFAPELRDIAGALYRREESVPPGTACRLAAEVLNEFFGFYQGLTEKTFLPEYRERSLLTGVEVTFTRGEETGRGRVRGIDDSARLVVELPGGEETALGAGEVQIGKEFLEQIRGKKE